MHAVAKWLMMIGGFCLLAGALIWLGAQLGIPLGHLPGDIQITREKYAFYFPIVTSIVVSIVLTIVLNVLFALLRK